jgi:antitoxin component YwqK of YwqJK toxin-antitoxin module
MKNFIVSLFLLCCVCAFSQTKHEDGPYKEYYKDGQLKKEGFYKNDKKNGVFKEYFKSGQLKLTGFYSNGNKIRNWQGYYENGQLRTVNAYDLNGEPTGVGESYSEEGILTKETKQAANGGLIRKEFYDEGMLLAVYALIPSINKKFVKAGGYKEYYKNGALKIESLYANNELSGIWRRYYETGEIEWEVEYNHGYRQGLYKQFYKNGILKLEGRHVADLKNGEEKRYDEKGSLLWKGAYFKDDFDDAWTQYDSIGNSINVLSYKKGKLKRTNNEIDLRQTEVPDGVFEHVPVYPGCEIFPGNVKQRDCFSKNIAEFVNRNFNTKVLSGTNITGKVRVNVTFKIDKTGKVIDIRAKAQHPNLEKEAIEVVSKLPIMKPGMQKGKKVTVPYSFPIVMQIQKNQS